MRRLDKNDKVLIEMSTHNNYEARICNDDGVYLVRPDIANKTCPRCKKECEIYEP